MWLPVPSGGHRVTAHLLTFAEAAERLSVPESWLKNRVAARQVPHTRLGKHVRFTEAQLDQIVAEAANGPTDPTPRRRLRAASP